MLRNRMLGEKAILERLLITGDLVVHPIIDLAQQIGPGSLDVRLGMRFQSLHRTFSTQTDPLSSIDQTDIGYAIAPVDIGYTEQYVLHPKDFTLGCTFEYVGIPPDLAVRLESRAVGALKRLDVHCTAAIIDPGFRGQITFELSNLSLMPIVLWPMMLIARLSFYHIGQERRVWYLGDLSDSASPELPSVF